jgi:hypothetical protein
MDELEKFLKSLNPTTPQRTHELDEYMQALHHYPRSKFGAQSTNGINKCKDAHHPTGNAGSDTNEVEFEFVFVDDSISKKHLPTPDHNDTSVRRVTQSSPDVVLPTLSSIEPTRAHQ